MTDTPDRGLEAAANSIADTRHDHTAEEMAECAIAAWEAAQWRPIEVVGEFQGPFIVYGQWYGEIGGAFDEGPSEGLAYYTNGASDYGQEGFWNGVHSSGYAVWCKPTHVRNRPTPPAQEDTP